MYAAQGVYFRFADVLDFHHTTCFKTALTRYHFRRGNYETILEHDLF
jgi:hypothetical protein